MVVCLILLTAICTSATITGLMTEGNEHGFYTVFSIASGIFYTWLIFSVRDIFAAEHFRYLLWVILFFVFLSFAAHLDYRYHQRLQDEFNDFAKLPHR